MSDAFQKFWKTQSGGLRFVNKIDYQLLFDLTWLNNNWFKYQNKKVTNAGATLVLCERTTKFNKKIHALMVRESYHNGQLNFPGGSSEQFEAPFETAFRETREETSGRISIKNIYVLQSILSGELTNSSNGYYDGKNLVVFFCGYCPNGGKCPQINSNDAGDWIISIVIVALINHNIAYKYGISLPWGGINLSGNKEISRIETMSLQNIMALINSGSQQTFRDFMVASARVYIPMLEQFGWKMEY